MGDFDGDGMVGPADASILAANWGDHISSETRAVPEPSLVVLGGAAMVALALWRRSG